MNTGDHRGSDMDVKLGRFGEMTVGHMQFEQADYVVRRMRKQDVEEVFSVRYDRSREGLVEDMVANYADLSFAFERVHVPRAIAVFTLAPAGPWFWHASLIATDEWPLVVKDVTRWLRKHLMPAVQRHGVRRVELRAMQKLTQNCAWIESLGARPECVVHGMADEPFVQYAWTQNGGATCAGNQN